MTSASSGSILTRFYYNVKPYVPLGVRWALRRHRATRIRERNVKTWPINEAASAPPESWPGWPGGKQFAFVITHDVEGSDGLTKVQPLAEMEAAYEFCSSFNFIPEGGYRVPEKLRDWLTRNHFEVGVHDLHHDGKLYQSRDVFKKKALRINHHLQAWKAKGFRSGFMLRRLDWLHDLDADYDASTFDTDPFEPQPDGCRTIFPFFVSDESRDDGAGYVELPYTLPQDSTLFLLLGEKSAAIWLEKLDWIAAHGGLALINIHPDYMDFTHSDFSGFRYPSTLVEDLLRHVRVRYSGRFWNPLPHELAAWYRGVHEEQRLRGKSLPTV